MITQTELDSWIVECAEIMSEVHNAAAKCLKWNPLTSECATCLNLVEGACAVLVIAIGRMDRHIDARYKEAKAADDHWPQDAVDAVSVFKEVKKLTLSHAKQTKAQCRRWNSGQWGQPTAENA